MSEDENILIPEEEITSAAEATSSKEETADNYEVGYRKPPKSTQFKKGVSGNPSGRPKRPLDFHRALLRKARAQITISDNGRPVRITKLEGIAMQVTNKALTGNSSSVKNFVSFYQQALENETSSAEQQAEDLKKYEDLNNLTDEQLEWLLLGGGPKELLRRTKK